MLHYTSSVIFANPFFPRLCFSKQATHSSSPRNETKRKLDEAERFDPVQTPSTISDDTCSCVPMVPAHGCAQLAGKMDHVERTPLSKCYFFQSTSLYLRDRLRAIQMGHLSLKPSSVNHLGTVFFSNTKETL